MALNLIALGFIGLILSFLVPDKKKATISLVLGILIVISGLYQWVVPTLAQMAMNRHMQALSKQQQIDLEQLREKLKAQALQSAPPASTKK